MRSTMVQSEALESKGLVIGAMDMLIAAHASSLGVTLVSNNAREFSRIANLYHISPNRCLKSRIAALVFRS